jgi:hypothetical protein
MDGWLHRLLCCNDVVRSTASNPTIKTKLYPVNTVFFYFNPLSGFCCKLDTLGVGSGYVHSSACQIGFRDKTVKYMNKNFTVPRKIPNILWNVTEIFVRHLAVLECFL